MARLGHMDAAISDLRIAGATPDFTIGESMEIAAEETIRRSPIAALSRQVKEWTDTSAKMSAQQANEKYGLVGTEAEFKDDDDITEDRALAVSQDFHALKRNEYITELVNDESPVLGRVAQFGASMAASVVDPSLLVANVGGAMLIGKGVGMIANSAKAINWIGGKSPTIGRGIMMAYEEGVRKSVGTVLMREGAENFMGSLIEETVNFAGVGEERLARKISTQESLFNILASTTLGAGAGTLMSKDGRKAIGRSLGRKYGDDAAELLKTNMLLSEAELTQGLPKSDFEFRMHDRQTFEPRPWQNEKYSFVSMPKHSDQKFYIPLEEDGTMFSVSNRGTGTVLTDNVTQAQNKGAKFIEVNTGNLRILDTASILDAKGRTTKAGWKLIDNLVDAIAKGTKRAEGVNANQYRKVIREELEGKDLETMLDILDRQAAKNGDSFDHHKVIEEAIEELGFNGYHFVGKKHSGDPAFNGLYVSEKFTRKIRKDNVKDSPNAKDATFQQKTQWEIEETKQYQAYAEWADANKGKLHDTAPEAEVEGAIPDPSKPVPEIKGRELNTRDEHAKLEAEIRAKQAVPEPKEGEPAAKPIELSSEEEAAAKYAKARAEGKKIEDLEATEFNVFKEFWGCMRGA